MGTASFSQNSFLGGEWSPQMQGRFDRPDYRTGMNLCLNIIPIEEGAAPRRSGTRLGGVTRSGNYGVLREYNVDQEQPYDLELTAGNNLNFCYLIHMLLLVFHFVILGLQMLSIFG